MPSCTAAFVSDLVLAPEPLEEPMEPEEPMLPDEPMLPEEPMPLPVEVLPA